LVGNKQVNREIAGTYLHIGYTSWCSAGVNLPPRSDDVFKMGVPIVDAGEIHLWAWTPTTDLATGDSSLARAKPPDAGCETATASKGSG
jgi:hypothetical protein